jgi:hypothetical protein
MARLTKAEKARDAQVDAAFKVVCDRVQINIFDIGKVMGVGKRSLDAGDDETTMRTKMAEFVATIRKN